MPECRAARALRAPAGMIALIPVFVTGLAVLFVLGLLLPAVVESYRVVVRQRRRR